MRIGFRSLRKIWERDVKASPVEIKEMMDRSGRIMRPPNKKTDGRVRPHALETT